MAIYGDDQCEECGAARVSGSKLCVGCLVKERNVLEKEVLIKETLIEMYKAQVARDQGRLEDALSYGFSKNQENAKLHQAIRELRKNIGGG